jgi:nuclear transport factor 2 (NTF2) superfamily protein
MPEHWSVRDLHCSLRRHKRLGRASQLLPTCRRQRSSRLCHPLLAKPRFSQPPLSVRDVAVHHAQYRRKVRAAQNLWNTKDPGRSFSRLEIRLVNNDVLASVVKAYTEDTTWRNRDQFLRGRDAAQTLLTKKWQREQHYMYAYQIHALIRVGHRRTDCNADYGRSSSLLWTTRSQCRLVHCTTHIHTGLTLGDRFVVLLRVE